MNKNIDVVSLLEIDSLYQDITLPCFRLQISVGLQSKRTIPGQLISVDFPVCVSPRPDSILQFSHWPNVRSLFAWRFRLDLLPKRLSLGGRHPNFVFHDGVVRSTTISRSNSVQIVDLGRIFTHSGFRAKKPDIETIRSLN